MSDDTVEVAAPPSAEPRGRQLQQGLLFFIGGNVLVLLVALALGRSFGDTGGTVAAVLFFSCLAQFVAGCIALFVRGARGAGAAAMASAPLMALMGIGATVSFGWGRPLRVRGRQVYPHLREGADWAAGPQPSPAGLDAPTRLALEMLWLHDAQKEHASVPAFARIGWMLAAVGAPADLMAWSQRAALQEVDHARRCFALAAGYGGRRHAAEPMPDLLLGGLELRGDPFDVLATESLQDGCQLEDFNADVAAASAAVCEEPVTRAVLEQIAREERSHAEFSWALLAWTLERRPERVRAAIARAERTLDEIPRPRAVNPDLLAIVSRAQPADLLRHGRLPDEALVDLWERRLGATRRRLRALTGERGELAGALLQPTDPSCVAT